MLLKELVITNDTKIKKINKILKETFGFTLVSDIATGKLNSLYTKISDDLYDLKLDLGTVKNAKYMQKVLVLEGLRLLIKRNKKIHEALLVGPGAHAYERVNKWLSEFVYKACEVGDDYEEAIRDAMKQYRSSKYRFEDFVVEHDLRKNTQECAGIGDMAFVESINKDDDCDICDDCKCDPCECNDKVNEDKYEHRKGAGKTECRYCGCKDCDYDCDESQAGGFNNDDDEEIEEGSADRHAEQDWIRGIKQAKGMDTEPGYDDPDSSGLSLSDPEDYGKTDKSEEPDDYFSYQRKKTMRENMKKGYIKNLRKLLEAEVEQAESLIAARSFSQELQDMVEKLGRLVNENLPAVSEQMRDAYGADVATGFEDQVAGTLNSVMDSLRNSKQEIDNSVSVIADGGLPSNDMADYGDEEMGGEIDDLDLDSDVELDLNGDELEVGDEFGGDDAMAGTEDEPLGRAKKESLKILGKKIIEAQAKLTRIKARL